MLELLTSLAEKSLLVTEGDGAPRYRMLGTIKEYAADRLAEAGESDLARQAHLAYFTELAETAEPHLRRAEQLDWLATLEAEHDNIGAAMRGAIAAGEAQAAMRLAAAAGWYWWLGGHRAEGIELIIAATNTPGEVTDEVRAMVYALVVLFVTSGRGDEHQAAEWIHQAYRFSQRSQRRNPLLGLVVPLERMLQAPDASVPAWESLLDNEDPWVRALARLQLGKMRIMLGQGGAGRGGESRDGARRVPGARRTVRDFVRPDRAGGADRHARRVRRCVRALRTGDRGRHRGRCHRGCHPDAVPAGPAVLAAGRSRTPARPPSPRPSGAPNGSPGRMRWSSWRWPRRSSLAGAATPRRPAVNSASRPPSWATTRSRRTSARRHTTCSATWPTISSEARTHRVAAWQAASEAGHAPVIAQVLVGFADLALRRDQYEQAARLLAASVGVRGLPDRSHPDVARIEQAARRHLGEARFAEATREGTQTSWSRAGRGHARFVKVASDHR